MQDKEPVSIKTLKPLKSLCIVCDIDGTVALMKGKRTPFEYHKAFEDEPNKPVIHLLNALVQYYTILHDENVWVIFTSARENIGLVDKHPGIGFVDVADLTQEWVKVHIGVSEYHRFIFRMEGDHRKDCYVKYDIAKTIQKEFKILSVLDDRNQVVDMWRNGLKLPCFQVADGNF